MLVAAESGSVPDTMAAFMKRFGEPAVIDTATDLRSLAEKPDGGYDDIVYFGSDPDTVELLFGKLGTGGLLNIALCGGSLGRKVAGM